MGKNEQWNMRNTWKAAYCTRAATVQLYFKLRCQVMVCLTRCFLSGIDELYVQKISDFLFCRPLGWMQPSRAGSPSEHSEDTDKPVSSNAHICISLALSIRPLPALHLFEELPTPPSQPANLVHLFPLGA